MLSAYEYEIEFKKGNQISNADGLSRLLISNKTVVSNFLYSFNLEQDVPISSNDIANHSKKDPIISKVIDKIN